MISFPHNTPAHYLPKGCSLLIELTVIMLLAGKKVKYLLFESIMQNFKGFATFMHV
jgi:hypothetical protein